MKKLSIYFSLMAALLLGASMLTACSDDDDEEKQEPVLNPDPEPEPEPEKHDTIVVTPHHFDITVTVGQQGGMGRKVTTIMQSVASLEAGPQVDFQGQGGEINATYSMEAILKGKYYYQVPFSADRFTKFEFKDDQVQVVQEQKFQQNTYACRSYCHAWENDSILMIMAADGDKTGIVWTELNTNDMRILREGKLSISVAEGWETLTTSGILAYRESDNRFFYFYCNKKGKGVRATSEDYFHVAVINGSTMAVEKDAPNTEANEMAGSAYGELLQQTTFFDEQGNLYLVAFDNNEVGEQGKLLRIKAGETDFEKGYNGFPNSDGKLLTTQYLGGGKVFPFSRNDGLTEDDGKGGQKAATGIDSYSHYYSIVDLNAGTRTRMSFGGQELDYSSGRFSQRSVFVPTENKVYFGVNTLSAQPCVYIYDVATGSVTQGVKIAEGYYFEQIRMVEEDSYTIIK